MNRTPNQIRDNAMRCFQQVAKPKYDLGQERAGTNLDEHPDLVGAIREELIDGWFYLESLAQQLNEKEERIAGLEAEVERWKEMAKR